MNLPETQSPVVLIIDDDQTLHLWANRNLIGAGFQLISCMDGEEGIEKFNEFVPNIVMVDVEMPGMNGFETCAKLRSMPGGKNIPIVMMTVTEDHQKIAQAYASGATDFAVKPINWKVLEHRLNYMVKATYNFYQLEQTEMRLSKAKQMARLGYWEWKIETEKSFWSDEFFAILGLDKGNFRPDRENYTDFIHPEDKAYVVGQLQVAIQTKIPAMIEYRVITAAGQVRFILQHMHPNVDHKGRLNSIIGIAQDITERKDQENKIRHLAYYDEVTQLPNRVFFLKFLAKTLELAKRHNRIFAIMFLDLDGFKGINDTYGHQVGDELLLEIAKRLSNGLRCSDMASRFYERFDHKIDVARLGGDEFTILLNELARPEDAGIVAERIRQWITEPVALGDRLIHVDVSIGIAVFAQDGNDANTLMKNADIAMYHAKKMGKGQFQFFHEAMSVRAKKRLEMETHMHHAIANNELRLHYQPIMDTASGRMVGAEALLRWVSPQLGLLPPNDFISLAEENGLINQFGEWAIREVCRQYKDWLGQGLGELVIAVNMSTLQFNQPGFIPMIAEIIQEYDVNPAFLTFELTESTIMADTENMLTKLKSLKNLGVKLALDDFGTGYSSLRYLNRFPLDALKIDRSFVQELPDNTDAAAIVNTILALAKALNLNTIAEGVENQQQLAFLKGTTCSALQGYHFSPPMPVADFKEFWLRQNNPGHLY
jgi:diguanylate cyclase (GGDEF)-like protein/PAS domain S-box-containing protein